MRIGLSLLVCDCGSHVRYVDQRAGTFVCDNPACAKYGKQMRISINPADAAGEKAVIAEYFEGNLS
jgi:hypothetical protein